MTCSMQVGQQERRRGRCPALCWVEMSTVVEPRPGGRPRSRCVTWVLPSGRRYGERPGLADLRRGAAASRCASQIGSGMRSGGLVAGVAEHHPLVARALGVEHVLAAASRCAPRRPSSTPWAMSGDCSSSETSTPQVLPSKPYASSVVADVADRRRGRARGCRRRPSVVISPATTTRPVVSERLAGHPAHRVLLEHGVEDGVGDLVGHLVGVALGDRLGGEGGHACSRVPPFRSRPVVPGRPSSSTTRVERRPRRRSALRRSAAPRSSPPSAPRIVDRVRVVLEARPRARRRRWRP